MKKILICLFILSFVCFPLYDIHAEEYEIVGPDQVLIPNAKESVAQYKVNQNYQFQVIQEEGITLDTQGLLTVTKSASEQEIIIQAIYGNHIVSKKVNLQYSWSKLNSDYHDYQVKEDINDLDMNSLFMNQTIMISLRIFLLVIGTLILIGYILKKGGNE